MIRMTCLIGVLATPTSAPPEDEPLLLLVPLLLPLLLLAPLLLPLLLLQLLLLVPLLLPPLLLLLPLLPLLLSEHEARTLSAASAAAPVKAGSLVLRKRLITSTFPVVGDES